MILSLYSHYINLAGIPFVPQRWEHFQFLESQREIEAVGVVVNSISAHLDGFDLDKGISQPFGFGFGLLKKRSADALPVIFLPHPHDGQLHGMPPGFFQIEKADGNIVRKGAEEWAAFAVRDVRFRSFRDAEPIRKHFQNGPCDVLFLNIAVNFL